MYTHKEKEIPHIIKFGPDVPTVGVKQTGAYILLLNGYRNCANHFNSYPLLVITSGQNQQEYGGGTIPNFLNFTVAKSSR